MRIILFISLLLLISAQAIANAPQEWQMGFQKAATPIMEGLVQFHNLLLVIILGIGGFVFCLLSYTCFKFRKSKSPTPSTRSHHILLEIVWTVIPVMILIAIAIPSLKLLSEQEKKFDADMTIKVVGHQWYWEYQYPDHGGFSFDSYIIKDEDLKPGQLRLLEVDNRVVVPINTNVKVLVTSYDVLHSWAVPALGVKKDAVPGRVNETWFNITKPGVYYGQCSEICGIGHGFMPIAVEAVEKTVFEQWTKKFQTASAN